MGISDKARSNFGIVAFKNSVHNVTIYIIITIYYEFVTDVISFLLIIYFFYHTPIFLQITSTISKEILIIISLGFSNQTMKPIFKFFIIFFRINGEIVFINNKELIFMLYNSFSFLYTEIIFTY